MWVKMNETVIFLIILSWRFQNIPYVGVQDAFLLDNKSLIFPLLEFTVWFVTNFLHFTFNVDKLTENGSWTIFFLFVCSLNEFLIFFCTTSHGQNYCIDLPNKIGSFTSGATIRLVVKMELTSIFAQINFDRGSN